ncbi:MAG: hypothetical protein K2N38_02075 [Oscillospiraceae bacterium]|nr:hypothetical protein [Oscillospiraceae bacterium]
MRAIGIIKPLKISAAALRKNIRKELGSRYETVPVLSLPKMIYLGSAAKTGMSGTVNNSFNITLRRSEPVYRLAAYFRDLSSYNASSKIKRLGYLSDSLFKSYTGLNQLTQALWSIYKSNNLQLSHSLLALIRTINEKNGIELDTYFEGLPRIVQIQKKMIGVLKSIDRSLFGQLSSRYGNSSVVSIGKQEIYRHSNTVTRRYEKNTAAFYRITENFHSMTPLLMRIYEGIETGVYLYSADSYRNAKTLQRLTNSLWKVYLGQNMELSRSFSRLITRVNQENKSVELRNAENNMFSDNRSLKNLVNALRKAFSGSNLELRNSMISLFGDIHKAGNRKNIAVNKRYDLRSAVGIIMLHREIVPEYGHIRLDHRRVARLEHTEPQNVYSRLEREIKAKSARFETSPKPPPHAKDTEDIVREVLEKINRKQQLDWRLEKLQRGIF